MKVAPDLDFIRDVMDSGGSNLKTCQQCATCSVICPLSPDLHPYPRKEMIWAAWGLKDRLMGDPDIWLCHQCGDCALACTRGSRPSEVLAGLRSATIAHFAVPRFMGAMVRDPRYLPLLLLGTLAFLAAMIGAQQIWVGETPLLFGEEHFEYEQFLAHRVINTFFPLAFFTAVGFAVAGALRFWRAMGRVAGDWGTAEGQTLTSAVIGAAVDLFRHDRFHRCDAGRPRWTGHLLVFYGFLGLLLTTSGATILTILEIPLDRPDLYPLGWFHPLKILGNLTGLLMVGGSLYVIYNRLTRPDDAGRATYTDWLFVALILTVGLSGFATEFVRLTPLPAVLGTPLYLVHLVAVFWVLIFFPYSKFAHAMYRFEAMVFARHIGRAVPEPRQG